MDVPAGFHIAYYNASKMFETPRGYSFLCNAGTSFDLECDTEAEEATASFKGLQLQPFDVKSEEFSKGRACCCNSLNIFIDKIKKLSYQ